MGVQLTLARKLDSVQRKTVSSSRLIPRVLLAKPQAPSFRLRPEPEADMVFFIGVNGGGRSPRGAGGSESLRLGASVAGKTSGGDMVGFGAAIVAIYHTPG